MSELDEITHLGTRILDRILKPVNDRLSQLENRIDTLERAKAPTTSSGFVSPISSSGNVFRDNVAESAPEPEPESEPQPEQPAPMPSPQVPGDLEHDEPEPA